MSYNFKDNADGDRYLTVYVHEQGNRMTRG